jgi:hypothetical protein
MAGSHSIISTLPLELLVETILLVTYRDVYDEDHPWSNSFMIGTPADMENHLHDIRQAILVSHVCKSWREAAGG